MTRVATAQAVTFRAGRDRPGVPLVEHQPAARVSGQPPAKGVTDAVTTKCGICVAALELEAASSGA